MSDQRKLYERDREDPYYEGRHTHRKEGFFERNCDEAWEQVKETFSHPGRLFAKVLLIALLCGVVAGGSYLLKNGLACYTAGGNSSMTCSPKKRLTL